MDTTKITAMYWELMKTMKTVQMTPKRRCLQFSLQVVDDFLAQTGYKKPICRALSPEPSRCHALLLEEVVATETILNTPMET